MPDLEQPEIRIAVPDVPRHDIQHPREQASAEHLHILILRIQDPHRRLPAHRRTLLVLHGVRDHFASARQPPHVSRTRSAGVAFGKSCTKSTLLRVLSSMLLYPCTRATSSMRSISRSRSTRNVGTENVISFAALLHRTQSERAADTVTIAAGVMAVPRTAFARAGRSVHTCADGSVSDRRR